MSIVTRVELEGGVYREPAHAAIRRARLDAHVEALGKLEVMRLLQRAVDSGGAHLEEIGRLDDIFHVEQLYRVGAR